MKYKFMLTVMATLLSSSLFAGENILPKTPSEGGEGDSNKSLTSKKFGKEYDVSRQDGKINENSLKDIHYTINGGEKPFFKEITDTGKVVIRNKITGETQPPVTLESSEYTTAATALRVLRKREFELFSQKERIDERLKNNPSLSAKEKNDLKNSSLSLKRQIEDLKPLIDAAIANAKKERKKLLENKNINFSSNEERFINKSDIVGKARGSVTKYFLSPQDGDSEAAKDAKKKNLEGFGYNPDKVRMDNLLKGDIIASPALAKLKIAYDTIKKMEGQNKSMFGKNTIKCYASRQLIPSYKCSIPGSDTIYNAASVGVDQSSRLKVSGDMVKKICEEDCIEDNPCRKVDMSGLEEETSDKEIELFPNSPVKRKNDFIIPSDSISISTDLPMSSISYEITTEAGENVPSDLNLTFEEIISTMEPQIKEKISMSGVTKDGLKIPLSTFDQTISSSSIKRTTGTSRRFSKIEITAFLADVPETATVLKYDPNKSRKVKVEIHPRNFIKKISLKNFTFKFGGKDLYFCPWRQTIPNINQSSTVSSKLEYCENGEFFFAGGMSICLDSVHKIGPDLETGGFYSEDRCNAVCAEQKECIPSYPSDVTGYSDEKLYRMEIGCVKEKDNSNSGCSDDMCRNFFARGDDKRVLNEVVYKGDEKAQITVRDGVPVRGTIRPKIDYDRESGAFSPNKYKVARIVSMKDDAYNYMIKNGKYNYIKYDIGTPSPAKQGQLLSYLPGNKKKLEVLVKPSSDNIGSGEKVYLYSVIVFDQTYKPKAGLFQTGTGVLTQNSDTKYQDRTFLIKSGSSWNVFRKIFKYKIGKVLSVSECTDPNDISTCTISKKRVWSIFPNRNDRYVVYSAGNDSFMDISMGQKATPYSQETFTIKNPFHRILITEDIDKSIGLADGSIIHDQNPTGNNLDVIKKYKGDFNLDYRGYVNFAKIYNIISDKEMTYGELSDAISNERWAVWDSANQQRYPKEILSDSAIKNNIKLYKLGKDDSVTIQTSITPDSTEEGAKTFLFLFLKGKEF